MNGEALYERYKDALKRGHVASLRGRLDEALGAYAEAAEIAPERSTPHTSAGTALLRRKRPADALRHYEVALRLVPRDEAALLGRGQALVALGRRGAAADAYDTLADVRATAGRLADAVDAARQGLELAEGRERRRTLVRLIDRLRESEPDEPGRVALEQALKVLQGMAVAPATAAQAGAEAPVVPGGDQPVEPEATAEEAGEQVVEAGPPPVRSALDRNLPVDLDLEALARAVEGAQDLAEPRASLDQVLDLAAVHRRTGSIDAALDACYVGLSLTPDDIELHLALVELYRARGWAVLANEKLDLLERLAALDGNDEAAARVTSTRAART